ncbi:MAG: tripartite tricarboxylate transporter substrate binding protein [Hyphomicrobium sp.]
MIISRRVLLVAASVFGLGFGGVATSPAKAQAWPDKPITFVNPFPAGGGTDAFARPLGAELTKQLGQSVIIDNKGGAGGTLGAGVAARAAKDGYTFFVGAVHHTIAPSIYAKLTYDLEKDFEPIAVIAMVPHVVVVNPARVQAKTLKELVAFAKANPGKLSFGSAGNGTSHHLAGEMFKGLTGTDIQHVPYKGAGPALQDLIGGQIDMMFDGLGSSSAHIKGGKIIPLAVAAKARTAPIGDVPTATEAGVAGFEASAWYAVWAVAGTPQAVKDKMAAEIAKALKAENVVKVWASQGAITGPAGADMAAFVKSQIESWGKVAKAANVKID